MSALGIVTFYSACRKFRKRLFLIDRIDCHVKLNFSGMLDLKG